MSVKIHVHYKLTTNLNIDCAENDEEAVRMFGETPEKYEMIFMDVQMPEMDGYEATLVVTDWASRSTVAQKAYL